MDHLLAFGSFRHLTPAELARAVHLDPSQINGLGPSMDSMIALLLERKHKILQTYETDTVQEATGQNFFGSGQTVANSASIGVEVSSCDC